MKTDFFLANTDDIGEIDSNAIATHDTTNWRGTHKWGFYQ